MSDAWIKEKQKALQLGVALRIYASENAPSHAWPLKLEDVLTFFADNTKLRKRVAGTFLFEDPATKQEVSWFYNCLAAEGSELLLASPQSPFGKRVVLLGNGDCDVLAEQEFMARFGT